MNKATSVWVMNYYFAGLGLPVPEDYEEHFNQNTFFEQYSSPMFMLCSGLAYKDFDFAKADKGDFEAQSYLANEVPKLIEPNRLIQLFNNLNIGFAWMYILREICHYVSPTQDAGKVVSNVRAAYNKYMESHEIRYAVFDGDGTDVPIIIDKVTGKVCGSFSCECVIYPETVRASAGTSLLSNAMNKPYYQLAEVEERLLRDGLDKALFSESACKTVSLPYVTIDGAVEYRDVSFFDENKPPKDVVALFGAMPKSLIDSCGDEIHALIAMVEDGSQVSDAVRIYVDAIKNRLVDDFDAKDPASKCYGMLDNSDAARKLERQGYVVKDLSTLIEEFLNEFNMSKQCTMEQFLEFYCSGEDNTTPPAPPVTDTSDLDRKIEELEAQVETLTKEKEELTKRNNELEVKLSNVPDLDYVAQVASKCNIKAEDIEAAKVASRTTDDFWVAIVYRLTRSIDYPEEPQPYESSVSSYATQQSLQLGVNPWFVEQAIKATPNGNDTLFFLELLKLILDNDAENAVADMATFASDLTALGLSDDEVNRILSSQVEEQSKSMLDLYKYAADYLAHNSAEQKVETKEYVDKFEEAGALMLHRVRESISKDAGFENRFALTAVMYTYFRLLMGDTEKEYDEVVEALRTGAEEAKPQGKVIIEEARQLLES